MQLQKRGTPWKITKNSNNFVVGVTQQLTTPLPEVSSYSLLHS